jgi:hypothetical protein
MIEKKGVIFIDNAKEIREYKFKHYQKTLVYIYYTTTYSTANLGRSDSFRIISKRYRETITSFEKAIKYKWALMNSGAYDIEIKDGFGHKYDLN